eukprot:CAMPEP_0194293256 /NCGR_PEP_ID=MMETSP0169-20130528/47522_1 /TAXON_ID=218684 /ORGANISM="Corethron pennatum, Strain L29A3" /LENGTH=661 /DNA_ID=CAMNT_0039041705 /DNA_START=153 /DNA_END=2135 /DNA_ORIENTATION=+
MSSAPVLPFRDALVRSTTDDGYSIAIPSGCGSVHVMKFDARSHGQLSALFRVVDAGVRGSLSRDEVYRFVSIRCPVFLRRDASLSEGASFDEAWCAVSSAGTDGGHNPRRVEFGAEAWMVFCRVVSLAQYQEARQRFLRGRDGDGNGDGPAVGLPPLSVSALAVHEVARGPLPPPELDLNHCLLAAYNSDGGPPAAALVTNVSVSAIEAGACDGSVVSGGGGVAVEERPRGRVRMSGLPGMGGPPRLGSDAAFAITVTVGGSRGEDHFPRRRRGANDVGAGELVVVRRTLADFEWLHTELSDQQALGQTLCGRIVPQPFPRKRHARYSSPYPPSGRKNSRPAVVVQNSTVGGLLRSILPGAVARLAGVRPADREDAPRAPSEHVARAAWLERHASYLAGHPAFATSFPLNALLRSSRTGLDAAASALVELRHASTLWPERGATVSAGALDPTAYPAADLAVHPSFTWIRSAAQAAVYLRLYGMLDAAGMSSASVRLQHASLPTFTFSSWRGGDGGAADGDRVEARPPPRASTPSSYGEGARQVSSELDADTDGYDLVDATAAPTLSPLREVGALRATAALPSAESVSSEKVELDGVAARPIGAGGGTAPADSAAVCPPHRYGIDPEGDGERGGIDVDRDVVNLRVIIAKLDQTVDRVLVLA